MVRDIIGGAPALLAVIANAMRVAQTKSTVLITGETGTGKELLAHAIHERSDRAGKPFISLNCAAIPSSLLASELFGHEKGAFTGAIQRRIGRFEQAEGGTLFLDEIGELTTEMQVLLLRVLQEGCFERLGGSLSIKSSARLIVATNRNLHADVEAHLFRSDLFYRLNVFPLCMPTLRERRVDIPVLVEHFLSRFADRMNKRIASISKGSLELLCGYAWPGNIRELQNIIERAVIVCDGSVLTIEPEWLSEPARPRTQISDEDVSILQAQEIKTIEEALTSSRGRVAGPFGAAAKLGLPASTLESKIKAFAIDKAVFRLPMPEFHNAARRSASG